MECRIEGNKASGRNVRCVAYKNILAVTVIFETLTLSAGFISREHRNGSHWREASVQASVPKFIHFASYWTDWRKPCVEVEQPIPLWANSLGAPVKLSSTIMPSWGVQLTDMRKNFSKWVCSIEIWPQWAEPQSCCTSSKDLEVFRHYPRFASAVI